MRADREVTLPLFELRATTPPPKNRLTIRHMMTVKLMTFSRMGSVGHLLETSRIRLGVKITLIALGTKKK